MTKYTKITLKKYPKLFEQTNNRWDNGALNFIYILLHESTNRVIYISKDMWILRWLQELDINTLHIQRIELEHLSAVKGVKEFIISNSGYYPSKKEVGPEAYQAVEEKLPLTKNQQMTQNKINSLSTRTAADRKYKQEIQHGFDNQLEKINELILDEADETVDALDSEYLFLKYYVESGKAYYDFEKDLSEIDDIVDYMQIMFYKGQCVRHINDVITFFQDLDVPEANQRLEYIHKVTEARDFKTTTQPEKNKERFPIVYNEAMLKGQLAEVVANEILHRYNIMHDTIAKFINCRMIYYDKVKSAKSLDDLEKILEEFDNEYHKASEL